MIETKLIIFVERQRDVLFIGEAILVLRLCSHRFSAAGYWPRWFLLETRDLTPGPAVGNAALLLCDAPSIPFEDAGEQYLRTASSVGDESRREHSCPATRQTFIRHLVDFGLKHLISQIGGDAADLGCGLPKKIIGRTIASSYLRRLAEPMTAPGTHSALLSQATGSSNG